MEISIYILLALLWAALSMLAVSYFFYRKLGKNYELASANAKNLHSLLESEKQQKEQLQLELVASKESSNRELSALTTKYASIIDIELAVENAQKIKDEIEYSSAQLNNDYKERKIVFDKLVEHVAIYDEEVMFAELGFYKPHFDFDASEKYKEAIGSNKQQQKELISINKAIHCPIQWTVEGSKTKGDAFAKKIIKLTARAFNNECDAGIANVRWNNVQRIEQRITKAFETINKLNESSKVFISPEYLNLKLSELRLTYEHANKKQQEKEEQAEIKRQIKEEALLKEEQEKALAEEAKYQALLEKATAEAAQSSGEKLERLETVILELNSELREAHAKSQRALSMAQQTKAGHVYIISNIGSFGENTFKIGMTRRLEPLDRVRELGDASVPFTFDVHAMIYTEDAPTLENELHKIFAEKRINLVNYRKEFFNVTLEEIQKAVEIKAPEAEFYITAEAREHRESLAIRAQREHTKIIGDPRAAFPDSISEAAL